MQLVLLDKRGRPLAKRGMDGSYWVARDGYFENRDTVDVRVIEDGRPVEVLWLDWLGQTSSRGPLTSDGLMKRVGDTIRFYSGGLTVSVSAPAAKRWKWRR